MIETFCYESIEFITGTVESESEHNLRIRQRNGTIRIISKSSIKWRKEFRK